MILTRFAVNVTSVNAAQLQHIPLTLVLATYAKFKAHAMLWAYAIRCKTFMLLNVYYLRTTGPSEYRCTTSLERMRNHAFEKKLRDVTIHIWTYNESTLLEFKTQNGFSIQLGIASDGQLSNCVQFAAMHFCSFYESRYLHFAELVHFLT